jgi:hypothetical protein
MAPIDYFMGLFVGVWLAGLAYINTAASGALAAISTIW